MKTNWMEHKREQTPIQETKEQNGINFFLINKEKKNIL